MNEQQTQAQDHEAKQPPADRPDILKRILEVKAQEVAAGQEQTSLAEMHERALAANINNPVRGFVQAIQQRLKVGDAAVIAEIKKASPSRGVLRDPFDPPEIARSYQAGGAACLSVLTDQDFFQGHNDYLIAARAACALPVIRKDFLIDRWQVAEARALGADCVLLIASALSTEQLADLYGYAIELGMDVLIEVHDRDELLAAQALKPPIIGINNRCLRTFEVSLDTTLSLLDAINEDQIVVTESGILSSNDVLRMRAEGVHAFLVGEAFMRADDPGHALAGFFAIPQR